MRCAEDYVRFCCRWVLDHCQDDLAFIVKMYDKGAVERLEQVRGQGGWPRRRQRGASRFARRVLGPAGGRVAARCPPPPACRHASAPSPSRLTAPARPAPSRPQVASSPFARCSYTEAIEKLEAAVKGGRKFENAVGAQGGCFTG
jgi:aspartyl/asparaginyl-tRNA synthetase